MNWNFLAMWIGMKTCDARFGPHQLAVALQEALLFIAATMFAMPKCAQLC